MSEAIQITVLVENSVHRPGLVAEHGLAFHIQAGPRSLLFDTGQTNALLHNVRALGCSVHSLDAVVLSHGHYDHTGGLSAILGAVPDARVFLHPSALEEKYSGDPGREMRFIGMSRNTVLELRGRASTLVETAGCTEIIEGVCSTGEIPRETDFEDTGGRFFLDKAGMRPDPLRDDQALFFDTIDGLVVLLGCGHAGVVNTLRHVQRLSRGRPISTVLGGFHLLNASPERMQRTEEAIRELNIRRLGPAHCTGGGFVARLWTAFPGSVVRCSVGDRFAFAPGGSPCLQV